MVVLDLPKYQHNNMLSKILSNSIKIPENIEMFIFIFCHYHTHPYMEVNATSNCLVTTILQNLLFYVQKRKETHASLEEHEGE